MKSRATVVVFLLILLVAPAVCLADVSTQTNLPPQPDSIVQITAQAEGLTQVALEDLPPLGTYWIVMPQGIWAPIPFLPVYEYGNPTYRIIDDIYLVDGTGGQVDPSLDQIDGMQILTGTSTSAVEVLGNDVADLIEHVQEIQMLRDACMNDVDLNPGDGGDPGGGGDGIGGNFVGQIIDTNLLWIEITGISGGTVYANLHNATNQVYAIWSTTDLTVPFSNWQVEAEVRPTDTNCQPFTVSMQNRDTLFLRAEEWTGVDSDGDGIPDWWTWAYWGTTHLADTNLDYSGNGNSFSNDFSSGCSPVVFQYSEIETTNEYVGSSSTTVQLDFAGTPFYVAVLVDSENFSNAVWNPLTSSNVTVNLGTTEGWHDVWVGLRGHGDDPSTGVWQWKRIKLDTTPPAIFITGPSNSTVDVPMIQLTGYSPETLSTISYDLSNTNGLWTNQPVTLLDRYFDTNIWDFTTNTFQAYDLPLTAGLNTFTIHATDMAGNVSTVNFSFTVDYSSKTNPNVQIAWPQDGMQISGSSFTLQGQLDDPTATVYASITDTNGNTSIATGLVERNGRFWIENLPMNGGTNVVSVTVSNIVGRTNVTTLHLAQNDLYLTMGPISDSSQLWQPTINVYGYVGEVGYSVWVNGIQASVDGTTWYADNVPVTPGGVAIFNVTAYPSTDTPYSSTNSINPQSTNSANLLVEMDKPPRLYVASYNNFEIFFDDDHYRGIYLPNGQLDTWDDLSDDQTTIMTWADQSGGFYGYSEITLQTNNWGQNEDSYSATLDLQTWPASVWPTLPMGFEVSSNYDYNFDLKYGSTNDVTNSSCSAPTIPQIHCSLKGAVSASYIETNYNGFGTWAAFRFTQVYFQSAQTMMKLQTGGKEGSGRQSLFQLSATALGGKLRMSARDGIADPDLDVKVLPPSITMLGQPLGSDSNLWVVLRDGILMDVPITVAGFKYYSFTPAQPVKYPLAIQANGAITLDRDNVTNGANFCVGQNISLSPFWLTDRPPIQSTNNIQWTLPGTYVNTNLQQQYPDASIDYTNDPQWLKCENTHAWWYDGQYTPPPSTASFHEDLTFPNGQTVTVTASGQYSMHKPKVVNYSPSPISVGAILYHIHSFGTTPGTNDDLLYCFPAANFKVSVESEFNGKAKITQLLQGVISNSVNQLLNSSRTNWLDNNETYTNTEISVINQIAGGTNQISFLDSPRIPCNGTTKYIADFTAYIRFNPDPDNEGIYVTLGTINWDFHSQSDLSTNGTIVDYVPPRPNTSDFPAITPCGDAHLDPAVTPSIAFPVWIHTVHNLP